MKIFLFTFILCLPFICNAQMNVNLERIETLAKDSTNSDFYYPILKEKFKSEPEKLSSHQIQTLYYQSLNELGSFNYSIKTSAAYADFKEVKFKKFIIDAEAKLEQMPTNISLLFLLSLAYGEIKDGTSKANNYAKKFKIVSEAITQNKSLTNKDYLIELNCITDEYILMQTMGIDPSKMKRTSVIENGHYIDTFELNQEKIYFKILNKLSL